MLRVAVLAGLLAAVLPAQRESLLIVERKQDLAERNRLEAKLGKVKLDVKLREATPKIVADYLNRVVGDVTMFVVRSHDGDRGEWAQVDLDLRGRNLRQALSIMQRLGPMRFVFRSGVVLIVHKDDVKELGILRVYDVRMAVAKIRNFRAPRIGLGFNSETEQEEEVEESDNTLSGLTLDKIEELIRTLILPESWGEKASMSAQGGLLFVVQSVRGHEKIRGLLSQIGIGTPALVRSRRARDLRRARVKSLLRKLPARRGEKPAAKPAKPKGAKKAAPSKPRSKKASKTSLGEIKRA